jgi:predicted Zn finger-like uncharacterized protein
MATSLAARCPACDTVFRVVPDQLRVSEGWVRCGRCSEVFNASENLVDTDTGAARRPSGEPPAEPPLHDQVPTPEDALQAADFDLQVAPPGAAASPPAIDPPAAAAQPDADLLAAGVIDPRAEPDDRPSFLRHAERAERWQRPRVRAALIAAATLGAAGLLAQVVFEYRDLVAARFPAIRPVFEQVCTALGCTLAAAHAIDSLAVESSGLVRVEASNIYRLSVALRNHAGIEVALPALDLTLTDAQGRVMARKVLRMGELGVHQLTLGAGRELALQATLNSAVGPAAAASDAPGQQPSPAIAGYTIELFYP